MKKIILYVVCFSLLFLGACTPISPESRLPLVTLSIGSSSSPHNNLHQEAITLLRADPRFIRWLEKESLYRHAPDLIRIVTGTSLGWRAPSSTPEKSNILASSPAWFYANPWEIAKNDNNTHFGSFLDSKSPDLLKNAGISALYFSPGAGYSLDSQLNNTAKPHKTTLQDTRETKASEDTGAIEQAIISYKIAEGVGTLEEYRRLERNPMIMGGDILEPALGVGPDFLLALRAVREYPGLFMMTELPRDLWEHFPSPVSNNESPRTNFSPQTISATQKELLVNQGLIPALFARDLLSHSQKQGFAISNPIRGVDSATRRWIYRYSGSPYRPLLNMSDPNLGAHKLFTASIIQQIGILHQPLIGISIADLWGQESYKLPELPTGANKDFTSPEFAEPALFALKLWNKSIHNYGSWSLVRDAFPMEYIPLLLKERSDFVADTVFMPALEASLITGKATALKTATKEAMALNITFSSLWHGSADTYQKRFLDTFFTMPSSMSLASSIANISEQEAKIIQKALELTSALHSDKELFTKYTNAKKIQFASLAFPALLPGMNFISGHDIRGSIPFGILDKTNISNTKEMDSQADATEKTNKDSTRTFTGQKKPADLPSFSLTANKQKNTISSSLESGIMLNPSLNLQQTDANSLMSQLKPIYAYRQKHRIGESSVVALLESPEEVFGLLLQSPTNQYYISIINTSDKEIRANIKIPFSKKNFTEAKDSIKPLTKHPARNRFTLELKAWEVRCFALR